VACGGPAIDAERLDELEQLGLVRIEDLGAARSVRPTREAIDAVARYQRERERVELGEPVDISWAAVRPVLHALVAV
jgi:hypothetical protein